MSIWPSRCLSPHAVGIWSPHNDGFPRFTDCEKWRKEFGVDNLVQNFEYKEKPKIFEYYPQYYHKTDKVTANRYPAESTV